MATDDFYEEQGRTDGAFGDYSVQESRKYLSSLHEAGVTNIEMESNCFMALCRKANLHYGVINVGLVDRLQTDKVVTRQSYNQYIANMKAFVLEYVKHKIRQ